MSIATFEVNARFGQAGGPRLGTVKIDRETNLVTIREKGKRDAFTVPLSLVVDLVVNTTLTGKFRSQAGA